jgi:hypothetical protein
MKNRKRNVGGSVRLGALALVALALCGCSGSESNSPADPLVGQLQIAQEKAGLIAESLANEPAGASLCAVSDCQVDSTLCGEVKNMTPTEFAYIGDLLGPVYAPTIKSRASSLTFSVSDSPVVAPDFAGAIAAYTAFDSDAVVSFNRSLAQSSSDAQKVALWFHQIWRTIPYEGNAIPEGTAVGGFTSGHAALDTMGACAVVYGASKGLVAIPVLSLLPGSGN